jgi:hypothetical protein
MPVRRCLPFAIMLMFAPYVFAQSAEPAQTPQPADMKVDACIADYLAVGALLKSNADPEVKATGEAFISNGLKLAVNAERAGAIGPIDEDALAASGNTILNALQTGQLAVPLVAGRVRACEEAFPDQYVLPVADTAPDPQTCYVHWMVSSVLLAEIDPDTSRIDQAHASRLARTASEAGAFSSLALSQSGERVASLFTSISEGQLPVERFAAQIVSCQSRYPEGQYQ